VFFESIRELNEFDKSDAYKNLRETNYTFSLTERDTDEDKESRIKEAPKSGNVTLITNSFGRGTDFICAD